MGDEYIPGQTEEDSKLSPKAEEIRAHWSQFRSYDDLNDPRVQKAMDVAAEDAAARLSPGGGENKQEG